MMLRSSRILSDAPYSRHAGKSVTESPPYRHPVSQARAQEVLAARLSKRAPPVTAVPMPPRDWLTASGSSVRPSPPCRRSARIAAQRTVATYMTDGSIVRVPCGANVVGDTTARRGSNPNVTVRFPSTLARSNTYADHEYGGGSRSSYNVACNHLTKLRELLAATREPGIGAKNKQNRIYDTFQYVEEYGHLFLLSDNHDLPQHAVGSPTPSASLRQTIVAKAREIRRDMINCVLFGRERNRFIRVLQRVEALFGDN